MIVEDFLERASSVITQRHNEIVENETMAAEEALIRLNLEEQVK
jgi:hypothetical protein